MLLQRSTFSAARRVALTLVALCAVVLAGATASPASAASKCKLSNKEASKGLGPTYTTGLTVAGTSCTQGKKMVRAYYKCRVKSGGKKGKCKSNVLGYRCSEKRSAAIPTQFDARVTCKKSKATIVHTYTQYT